MMFWSPNSSQSLNTLKLVNDPRGIGEKKVRNILHASVLRVNNFDTINSDPDAQLLSGVRREQPELHLFLSEREMANRPGFAWVRLTHRLSPVPRRRAPGMADCHRLD